MAVERIEPPASPHLPPHNLEAEQSVLGAMLVNPNAITAVAESLTADDFYRDTPPPHLSRRLTLFDRGEEVDVVTLSAQLEREGMLERAGGREFVTPWPSSCRRGQRRALRRHRARAERAARAHPVGNEIAELGYQHPSDPTTCSTAASRRCSPSSSSAASPSSSTSSRCWSRNFEHLATLEASAAYRRRHRVRRHRQAHRRLPEGQPHRARRPPRRRQDDAWRSTSPRTSPPRASTGTAPRSPSSAWR